MAERKTLEQVKREATRAEEEYESWYDRELKPLEDTWNVLNNRRSWLEKELRSVSEQIGQLNLTIVAVRGG